MKRSGIIWQNIRRRLYSLSNLFNAILFCFLRIARPFREPAGNTDSVLIVRCAHIGDFVLWLDSARAYREIYPGKKLIFLCPANKDVSDIARRTGYFDEVLVVCTGIKHRFKTVRMLMKTSYDAVINTVTTRELKTDLFALSPRSFEYIAPESDLTLISRFWLKRSDSMYTKIIPRGSDMELLRNARFVRGLGASDFKAALPVIPETAGWTSPAPRYFAVCPGANRLEQRWEPEKFAAVCDKLIEESGLTCLILGSQNEQPAGEKLLNAAGAPGKYTCLIGKTGLSEYIEAIRRAAFILTCDTSAAHIAAAVRTPCVVLGAGWNTGRYYPYQTETAGDEQFFPLCVKSKLSCIGCGRDPGVTGKKKCLRGTVMKCVSDIETEDVLAACSKLPEKRGFHAEQCNQKPAEEAALEMAP